METDNSLDSSGMQDSCVVMQEVGTVHAGEQRADSVHTSESGCDT